MVALTEICPPARHLFIGFLRRCLSTGPREKSKKIKLYYPLDEKYPPPTHTHTFYSDILLFVHVVVFLLLPDLAPRGREWPRAHKADEHVARARGGWLARVAHAPG